MDTFLMFLLVGALAQAIDGALGMAYGVISSSVLLAFGVPPATASASVHGAEVFTTAASAGSHVLHKNVEWRLFLPLAVAGIVGGVVGETLWADTHEGWFQLALLWVEETARGQGLGRRLLQAAEREMRQMKDEYVSGEHVLLALAAYKGPAGEALRAAGVLKEGETL